MELAKIINKVRHWLLESKNTRQVEFGSWKGKTVDDGGRLCDGPGCVLYQAIGVKAITMKCELNGEDKRRAPISDIIHKYDQRVRKRIKKDTGLSSHKGIITVGEIRDIVEEVCNEVELEYGL